MLYEIDFEMPTIHAGHQIGIAEGTVHIKTFGHSWWIVDAFLRDQETNQLFKVEPGLMFGVIKTWVEYDKAEQIDQLILSVAA